MSEEAINSAMVRLERALGRIERAAAAREFAGSGIVESYSLLQERHETLRTRVRETIAGLDNLIGQGGQR